MVLEFPNQAVTLGPGETRQIEVSKRWANPKLWWPWSITNPRKPHLYRLRSRILTAGETVDDLSTRFGFREFRIAGRHFELNGRRFKTRLDAMVIERLSHEGARERYQQWFSRHKSKQHTGPMLLRAHLNAPSSAALDVADELGVLFEVEGPLSSIKSNWASPEMWQNYQGMLKALFDRDKNHPSVLMWSITNKILICTNTWPAMYESNQKNLLELGRLMQSLDPTRPSEFNGGADIDGTWSVMNLHYPRNWFLHPDLPNSAFWLRFGARDLPCDQSWPFRVTWEAPKPVVVGEDGLYLRASVPHDFSSLAGEEPYHLVHDGDYWSAGPVADRGHAMILEGYRDAEVAITCNAYGGTGGPACDRAQMTVRSFGRQRDTRFFAGDVISRSVNLHHDEFEPAQVKFSWTLTCQEKRIAGDEQTDPMQAGELKRLSLEFTVPQVSLPTAMVLTTTVSRNGQQVFEETHDYMAYPRLDFQSPPNLRVGLFDRPGRTAKALNEQGIKYLRFGTMEPGTVGELQQLNCLLIGENGLDSVNTTEFTQVIVPWVESGGVVICLRQQEGLEQWMPVELRQDTRRATTIAWPRHAQHPVLKGISADMLRYWRGDHIVSTGDFLKAPLAGWHPIIDAGGSGGLRWAPLVEMSLGQGTILLCQMHLTEKLHTEPTATMLLKNSWHMPRSSNHRKRAASGSSAPPTAILPNDWPPWASKRPVSKPISSW